MRGAASSIAPNTPLHPRRRPRSRTSPRASRARRRRPFPRPSRPARCDGGRPASSSSGSSANGPAGIEDLPRDVFVRLLVDQRGHDRAVAVVPRASVNPASSRVGDCRPSAATSRLPREHAPVVERDRHAVRAALALRPLRRRCARRSPARRAPPRTARAAGRGWRTSGRASLRRGFGRKSIRPGFMPSVTAMPSIGQPSGSSRSARPMLREQVPARGRDRRGAAVGTLGGRARRDRPCRRHGW